MFTDKLTSATCSSTKIIRIMLKLFPVTITQNKMEGAFKGVHWQADFSDHAADLYSEINWFESRRDARYPPSVFSYLS